MGAPAMAVRAAPPAVAREIGGGSRPAWLFVVWTATVAYLVVEFSFNARLLDVVGGGATGSEIDAIEVWGRLISGFALALLGWPFILKRKDKIFRNPMARTVPLFAWTALAMAGMYMAQEALIRTLVERANTQELVEAQHLMLLRSGLEAGVVELPGLGIARDRLREADGKAFLAMFPMLGTGLGAIVGEQFSATQRTEVTRNLAIHKMGDPNDHLRRYADLVGELEEGYRKFSDSLSEIDGMGQDAWAKYVRELKKNRMTPKGVPPRHRERVRSRVRAMGVRVPGDWKPSDKAGFLKAAGQDGRRQAQSRFVAELAAKSPALQGAELPDTFDEFMAGEDTKTKLLAALGYECLRTFDPAMKTGEDFKTSVYDAEVDCQVARHAEKEGQIEAGRDAMRGLLVPMIALALSLLGALTHIGKVALQTTRLVKGRDLQDARRLYGWVFMGPIVAMLLFAWLPLSEITETSLYRGLERHIKYPLAMVVRGTVHGQHLGYPLFEATRIHLLRGFTFGYTGESKATPAAEIGAPRGGNPTSTDSALTADAMVQDGCGWRDGAAAGLTEPARSL